MCRDIFVHANQTFTVSYPPGSASSTEKAREFKEALGKVIFPKALETVGTNKWLFMAASYPTNNKKLYLTGEVMKGGVTCSENINMTKISLPLSANTGARRVSAMSR